MNDRLNAPVEPHDDGTVQHEPLYQEPSEGVALGDVPASVPAFVDDEAAARAAPR